jgi:hypothetical protein
VSRRVLSAKRIERHYLIWMVVVWLFRVVAAGFACGILWAVFSGEVALWGLYYLTFPPLWWVVTIFWKSIATYVRETQYALLRRSEVAS